MRKGRCQTMSSPRTRYIWKPAVDRVQLNATTSGGWTDSGQQLTPSTMIPVHSSRVPVSSFLVGWRGPATGVLLSPFSGGMYPFSDRSYRLYYTD